jgi:uncharacterized membrane protein
MTLTPFLTAPVPVQLHTIAALLALVLGPVALYRKRRDRLHKITGYAWMLAILVAALSSFAITNFALIGPFSPIHLLSVLALWSLWRGLVTIRAGQVAAHRRTLGNLYWRGLVIAGLFNFLPTGRLANQVVFPEAPHLGWYVIALGMLGLGLQALWDMRLRRNDSLHLRSVLNIGARTSDLSYVTK